MSALSAASRPAAAVVTVAALLLRPDGTSAFVQQQRRLRRATTAAPRPFFAEDAAEVGVPSVVDSAKLPAAAPGKNIGGERRSFDSFD